MKKGSKRHVEKTLTLSKKQRLVKNDEFRSVLSQRHRCYDAYLVMHMAVNESGYTRLGVSIGRAHGNAVQRNRIKRWIREAFRIHQQEIPVGVDILVTMAKSKRDKSRKRSERMLSRPDVNWDIVNASFLNLMQLCLKKIQ